MSERAEVFALTDEQILGVEPEVQGEDDRVDPEEAEKAGQAQTAEEAGSEVDGSKPGEAAETDARIANAAEQDAAKAAEKVATLEARARELEEIDAAFFGASGKSAEETRADRVQLAQRMMEQDPAAFRAMVEAAVSVLGGAAKAVASGQRPATGEEVESSQLKVESTPTTESSIHGARDGRAQAPAGYAEFERAANVELEQSVGGAISRALEQALPNLKASGAARGGVPLQERLSVAARQDVEAGLKSDAQLGEQVARVLAGRRFDAAARAQVVRLIDARAQQLVPGAVRRVVSEWTEVAVGTRGSAKADRVSLEQTQARLPVPRRGEPGSKGEYGKSGQSTVTTKTLRRGRLDYGKLSDEEILSL